MSCLSMNLYPKLVAGPPACAVWSQQRGGASRPCLLQPAEAPCGGGVVELLGAMTACEVAAAHCRLA